jgi:hypothetical protein
MAYALLTTCDDCGADFGELTDNDSHFDIWPYHTCGTLVLAQRNI